MIATIFLLATAISANTLSVVEADAMNGLKYVYPIAGIAGDTASGMEISNIKSDYSVGDFLTDIPRGPSGEAVDWERTYADIINAPKVYKDQIYCVENPKSDQGRILFTQGGAARVTWYYEGVEEGVERVYQIAESSSERPNRLYWSSYPFLGPKIDLTGKFVRLFGNPDVLKQEIVIDEVSHTTNVVSGIELSESGSTQILEAKARVIDVDKKLYEGPSGQFVLAYYTDGSYSKFIGSVVVEVGRPETKIIEAHVGDELLPTGDGWTVKGLLPYPKDGKGGTEKVEGDEASPHLSRGEYVHGETGDKVIAAYAISPNDHTTRNYTEDSPTKNDIFWEKPDFTGTLWPFEEDLYLVKWNPDDHRVVVGDIAPGLEIFVPTKYTVELCDYQDPSGTAEIDSQNANVVRVLKEGCFTLKLSTTAKPGTDVWYLPLTSKSRTNAEVVNAERTNFDVEYPVGRLLEPLSAGFAGTAKKAYEAVDTTLPGYVYEPASTGRNWNPRLYHAPQAPSANDTGIEPETASDDPFAALASTIYSVGVSETPIEVWWRGETAIPSRLFGASEPLVYPVAVQRYKARAVKAKEVREIALASKLGSRGKSYGISAAGLTFEDAASSLSLLERDLFTLPAEGFSLSLDLYPDSVESMKPENSNGQVLILNTANLVIQISRRGMDYTAYVVGYDGSALKFFQTHDFTLPGDEWSHFSFEVKADAENRLKMTMGFDTAETVSYDVSGYRNVFGGRLLMLLIGANPDLSVTHAPVGLTIDNLCFADRGVPLANWTFEHECVSADGFIFDETSYRRGLRVEGGTEGLLALQGGTIGGAPTLENSGLPYNDEVTPEIYRQPDPSLVGYHLNTAHAFVRGDQTDGTYTTWAVRADLTEAPSDNLVFTMYSAGGKGAQKTYRVVETNEFYETLESSTTAGHQLLPPAPLCYLDGYWNESTSWASFADNLGEDKCIVYRDRKLNDWARRDGQGFAFYFYQPREDFDWPESSNVEPDGLVPWEDRATGTPLPWLWTVEWPPDDEVKTMKVAQTLTKAVDNLPEVWNMASCGVIYPKRGLKENDQPNDVVDLVDPTIAQTAALPIKTSLPVDYGFTVGNSGTCQLRKGRYTFTGLPPSISDRFYIDTNADASRNMVLVGQLMEPATGKPYLQLNVLSDQERQAIKDICVNATEANKRAWDAAVDTLAKEVILPSQEFENLEDWNSQFVAPTSVVYTAAYRPQYQPVDHYALMASGNGSGYVVLIENDATNTAMVAEGNPIDVKVIKVLPELYNGSIMPLLDPLNKLSEQLTIQYNEPFGAATANYEFEWRRRTPEADGTINTDFTSWPEYRREAGLTSFTLGGRGTSLQELVNTYYVMRYRAKEGTRAADVCGTDWSAFTSYTLAEGWVQRVLNAVTPFNQRMSDFYANEAEIRYTMFEQIGRPYEGDVALNDANLNSIGLLQLYRTVLNKAEKMSLDLDINDVNVNKQLLLATSRIADLYMLLGAEAYADAKNPLISSGWSPSYLSELKELPSSIFCFQNQVRTLLDEELALLRGRDNSVQNPGFRTTPIYNRLIWNFTKGITEGEVAYVNNYGIRPDATGDITVDAAAEQYPQGHGDAYGHYLSAIKGYYHLLRNQNFGWSASMMEMMISASVVNEDYQDEQKFADAAVKLAETGRDVVDLTARKAWRDNGGDVQAAYFDGSEGEDFGYGEFAVRAGLGAAYNWLAVNSILPTNAAPESIYTDLGLRQITRGTASQLDELAEIYDEIERKVNMIDSGMNPLGLSQNAIPMDIDPTDLKNRNSHFEQILERTERALANCETVLDWAKEHGGRLKQIQNAETTAIADQEAQELAYKNQLIALYGTPYAGDIGPSGTYEQGYDGPDLYHYMWMDLNEFGLDRAKLAAGAKTVTLTMRSWDKGKLKVSGEISSNMDSVTQPWLTVKLNYSVAANGIILPTVANPGLRAMEGTIQQAYRDYLAAFVRVESAKENYNASLTGVEGNIERAIDLFNGKFRLKVAREVINDAIKIATGVTKLAKGIKMTTKSFDEIAQDSVVNVLNAAPFSIAGLAIGIDAKAMVAAALMGPLTASQMAATTTTLAADNTILITEAAQTAADIIFNGLEADQALDEARESLIMSIKGQLSNLNDSVIAYRDAIFALQAAEAAYRAEVAKGDQLQEERATWRARVAGDAAQIRYLDMYSRIERNNALTKYSTAYDTAQRYVWELAKVYDYETGLLSADPQAASKFYAEIIGSRQLGYQGISTSSATDKGLYDIVHRMKENFAILKPRLGINNPDETVKEFSLRYELFRIDPGVRGDEAWKLELRKYWTDDINANADFRRVCQPLAAAGPLKEPGLVIPFSTTIETAKNFFGRSLQGRDHAYSSADYATKIAEVGVGFVGYDRLTEQSVGGLAADPNVYLVPAGVDYLRAPTSDRKILGYRVIDQVLPLPYTIGSSELDDENYITTFSGLDGTSDSAAKIRKHSTLVADGSIYSTRLVGRSVWNDRWLLVIPAASLNANRAEGLETFIKGVSDIRLGVKAYARHGN